MSSYYPPLNNSSFLTREVIQEMYPRLLANIPYEKAGAQAVSWATTSTLAIHVLDWLHHLPDEVECMWYRGKTNHVKVHYFLSRYLLLVLHATHYALASRIASGTATLGYCIGVYMYRVPIIICGEKLVETGLFFRVVALYHTNRLMVTCLVAFYAFCTILQLVAEARIMVKSFEATTACIPVAAERSDLILLGIGVSLSQASFLVMTLHKLISEQMWKKTALASLLFREAIYMFILLTLTLGSLALCENLRIGSSLSADAPELLFGVYILALSLIAPRLTLHIRKAVVKDKTRTPCLPEPEQPCVVSQTKDQDVFGRDEDTTTICLSSYVD